MKKRLLCSVLAVVIASCVAATDGPARAPAADPQAGAQIIQADNELGFKLFKDLFSPEPAENIFISPTSIAMALAMTWNGAEGKTRDAIAEVLGVSGMNALDVNIANSAILAALKAADPKVQLEIANSLWGRQGIPFSEKFIRTNAGYYDAEITDLDFADPKTPDVINGWVKKKTHDKIEQIVGRIDPLDVLFLINAVYFKGRWTDEFDKDLTRDRDFHLADGSTKQHSMMRRSGDYLYYEAEEFQAISLPYGTERFEMLIFLPGEETGLAGFVSELDPENWNQWLASMSTKEGEIVLPRFKLEYEKTLNEVLSALGMEIAFDRVQADFSGMLIAPIDMAFYISEVLHKTFVEVNEEGTEAAAVTSVKMALTAMPRERDRFTMVVDRPFFYAIRDRQTGAVLFLGAVTDPES